jgi:gluconate 2-dehydrogenase gamma chain
VGLVALQAYANSAYGGNFETLSSANQLLLLQDLWANKPTSFSNILPSDFAYELTFMTWAGFLMDPIYGGNQNMVGWTYTGFNGVNFGNFYGEGQDQKALMVATTPTRLKPASLAQYQQQASGGV